MKISRPNGHRTNHSYNNGIASATALCGCRRIHKTQFANANYAREIYRFQSFVDVPQHATRYACLGPLRASHFLVSVTKFNTDLQFWTNWFTESWRESCRHCQGEVAAGDGGAYGGTRI